MQAAAKYGRAVRQPHRAPLVRRRLSHGGNGIRTRGPAANDRLLVSTGTPSDRMHRSFASSLARARPYRSLGRAQTLTQNSTWPNHQLHRTAFEPDNGRSVLAAGTALHAPNRSSRTAPRNASVRWK